MDKTNQMIITPKNVSVGDIIKAELPLGKEIEPVRVVQKYRHFMVCERKSKNKVIADPNLAVKNKYCFCVFYFEANPQLRQIT